MDPIGSFLKHFVWSFYARYNWNLLCHAGFTRICAIGGIGTIEILMAHDTTYLKWSGGFSVKNHSNSIKVLCQLTMKTQCVWRRLYFLITKPQETTKYDYHVDLSCNEQFLELLQEIRFTCYFSCAAITWVVISIYCTIYNILLFLAPNLPPYTRPKTKKHTHHKHLDTIIFHKSKTHRCR